MNKSFVYIPLIIGVLFLSIPNISDAAQFKAGEQVTIAQGEAPSGDVYVAGGSVTVSAPIDGDLHAAGGSVIIPESVSADLSLGGGNLMVVGDVGDDLRVAGGSVVVSGKVGGDLVGVAGQLQLTGPGVSGDVIWAGGVLTIDAPVQGNVRVVGGELHINAPIQGTVEFKGDELSLGSGAILGKTLTYAASEEAEMAVGAQVRGAISYEPHTPYNTDEMKNQARHAVAALASVTLLLTFLAQLAGAMALGLYFHKYAHMLTQRITEKALSEFGRGAAVALALPLIGLVLVVSGIGLFLGTLALLGFAAVLISGYLFAPVLLGSLLYRWFLKDKTYTVSWKTILLGVLVYTLLGLIPLIGWLLKTILVLMVIGALVKIKWGVAQQWR